VNAQGALSVRVTIPADAAIDKDAHSRDRRVGTQGTAGVELGAAAGCFPTPKTDGDGIKDMCDNCPQLAATRLTSTATVSRCLRSLPYRPDNGAARGADGNVNHRFRYKAIGSQRRFNGSSESRISMSEGS
jgi:hypothetical protein